MTSAPKDPKPTAVKPQTANPPKPPIIHRGMIEKRQATTHKKGLSFESPFHFKDGGTVRVAAG